MDKTLYKGDLNWYGEIFHLYAYALSEADAKEKMFLRLAKKLHVLVVVVRGYYKHHPYGWKITKEELR